MAFEAVGLLVLGHVLFASLWFGGAVYQVSVIGPTLMNAGPAGTGFVLTLARRGGIGRFFSIVGGLAIVFGFILFGIESATTVYNPIAEPMSGRGLWLSLGAAVAVVAYLHGMAVNMPTERKWIALCNSIKGNPTKEQGLQLAAHGEKLGKNGAISTMLIGAAMLLMLLSRVFP